MQNEVGRELRSTGGGGWETAAAHNFQDTMSALITMNIPRADDARKSVEQGEYDKAVKQADEVATAINTAIALGKKSIGGSGRLEASVRTKLQEMGYQYSTGTQYNESYWSVSWENPLPSKK